MKNNDCLTTPKYITDALGPFDLDPCAGVDTKIAAENWAIERGEDGFKRDWNRKYVWCNPPFSEKELWIEKMIENEHGILILPERGSAPWFGHLAKSCGFYFVMGQKINFIGGPSSNNVGSVLFPFGVKAMQAIHTSGLPGHFVNVKWFRDRNGFLKK